MNKTILLLLFSFILSLYGTAQTDQGLGYKTIDAGGEFQWYPTGTISGLHLAYNFPFHHGVNIRIGYNKANHKDKGVNDNETGGGWGATLGYRYYFRLRPVGFFLGVRNDVWRMKMNWQEGNTSGTSKMWVIQPTAELGYMFLINDQFFITPTISNGYEVNIKTEGQKTGQGFITLLGVSTGFKF